MGAQRISVFFFKSMLFFSVISYRWARSVSLWNGTHAVIYSESRILCVHAEGRMSIHVCMKLLHGRERERGKYRVATHARTQTFPHARQGRAARPGYCIRTCLNHESWTLKTEQLHTCILVHICISYILVYVYAPRIAYTCQIHIRNSIHVYIHSCVHMHVHALPWVVIGSSVFNKRWFNKRFKPADNVLLLCGKMCLWCLPLGWCVCILGVACIFGHVQHAIHHSFTSPCMHAYLSIYTARAHPDATETKSEHQVSLLGLGLRVRA
jgi:hypothetical protein